MMGMMQALSSNHSVVIAVALHCARAKAGGTWLIKFLIREII